VDRVFIRSFRASDLTERGLKDLARSRLDTTREVVFQALGHRFFEARKDPARIAILFREDAFHAPDGYFTRMALRVEPHLTERLASLDPRAVEAKLEEAARNAIIREWPRAQGAYLVRFEPSARGDLEPVAHVHLSSRRTDGGQAPALTREDSRRFEAAWSREVERAFALSRGLVRDLERERPSDRTSVLRPESERLRQEWAQASLRLFAVYTARLAGQATPKELVEAAAQARAARMAWSRQAGRPVDLRDVEQRQVFDVIRLRIEGGSRYFRGPLEAHHRTLLETAASRAAGLPDGSERRVAVVAWPAGPDLHAAVYFNQRSRPEALPEGIEPERLRSALEARLSDEIRRFAPSLDPAAEARAAELGRVEARLSERALSRERRAAALERPEEPAQPAGATAIIVTLEREHEREAQAAPPAGRGDQREALDRLPPPERDWSRERAFSVRLRVPTGAEELARMGLSADEVAQVLQRAVNRAYPFLEREGIRDNFLYTARGKALDVQILVPEKLRWSRGQLRSPQFQQRFLTGFHRAIAQIGPSRMGPTRERLLPGFVRGLATIRQAPQLIRRAEQDPERAARDVARAVFSKLSEALPKPFRLMRELGRTLSRFGSRGE
jgi:hypothetical protein